MSFTYKYPRPAVTVDCVVLSRPATAPRPSILLIKRGRDPFRGSFALPGGFVDESEDLATAALRELKEETSVATLLSDTVQVGAFGTPGRDPRGHTVTVAYTAWADPDTRVEAADDADDAKWFDVTDLPPLAFDHRDIILAALQLWTSGSTPALPDAPGVKDSRPALTDAVTALQASSTSPDRK